MHMRNLSSGSFIGFASFVHEEPLGVRALLVSEEVQLKRDRLHRKPSASFPEYTARERFPRFQTRAPNSMGTLVRRSSFRFRVARVPPEPMHHLVRFPLVEGFKVYSVHGYGQSNSGCRIPALHPSNSGHKIPPGAALQPGSKEVVRLRVRFRPEQVQGEAARCFVHRFLQYAVGSMPTPLHRLQFAPPPPARTRSATPAALLARRTVLSKEEPPKAELLLTW